MNWIENKNEKHNKTNEKYKTVITLRGTVWTSLRSGVFLNNSLDMMWMFSVFFLSCKDPSWFELKEINLPILNLFFNPHQKPLFLLRFTESKKPKWNKNIFWYKQLKNGDGTCCEFVHPRIFTVIVFFFTFVFSSVSGFRVSLIVSVGFVISLSLVFISFIF